MKTKIFLLGLTLFIYVFSSACFSGGKGSDASKPSGKNQGSATSKDGANPDPDKSKNSSNEMTTTSEIKSGGFTANLPTGFVRPTDAVGQKMLTEYGAMFVAKGGVVPPPKVVFDNEAEVSAWQSQIAKSSESIGGARIELQTPAMNSLKNAIADAKQNGASIVPRGGSDAARRDYAGTVANWKSRVDPGLTFYVGNGRLPQTEAARIKSLPIPEQITEIFKLESDGMYFAKDLSKSIIYSVAPPGTSQHISMLALDVAEHDNSQVRGILAKHGWFQTVVSDLPHFTYLGVPESDLPNLGLKKVSQGGRDYWVPE